VDRAATDGRTLWEQGRQPGRLVAVVSAAAAVGVMALDLALTDRVSLFFDLCFVTICVAAALGVRPRDMFVVGVLPPLLMLGIVLTVAVTDTGAIAEPDDGLVQALVSGLAHHAGALVAGYGLTLAILAARQSFVRRQAVRRRTPPDVTHDCSPLG